MKFNRLLILFTFFLLIGCNKKKTEKAAVQMQDFVIQLSQYSKSIRPDFKIIPQNGIELAFTNGNPEEGLNTNYLDAVDGFGIEELFSNGKKISIDNYRLQLLQQAKKNKTVLVSDYTKDDQQIPELIQLANSYHFLSYPRRSSNYYYQEIENEIQHENKQDISQLSDAKNYLYLISTDNYSAKTSYLNALKSTNYDVLLIDLFFNDEQLTAQEINSLKKKQNGSDRLVLAYMNIGSAEKFRYYWKEDWKLHHPHWLKKKYPGYDDEIYVEFWNPEWQNIILYQENSYLKRILEAGFDGVYLDNVEVFFALYHL